MLEDKELEKLKDFQKRLEQTPAGKQLLEQEAAAVLATRTTAAAAITALKIEQEKVVNRQDGIDKMVQGLIEHDKKREEMQLTVNKLRADKSADNYAIEQAIRHHEQILLSSSAPEIDDAIKFFNDKLTWLRSPGRVSHSNTGAERNIFTEQITTHSESNYPAVLAAIDYCRNSLSFLEQLKLQPEFNIEIIEQLKKQFPSIEIYTEATGEKPMEGSKGRSLASYFKSDSHYDYDMRKLLEKADKILSPAPKRARA